MEKQSYGINEATHISQIQPDRMERCVICGTLTEVPMDLPVSERETYMEGAGQLCLECCWKLYQTTDLRDNIDSDNRRFPDRDKGGGIR